MTFQLQLGLPICWDGRGWNHLHTVAAVPKTFTHESGRMIGGKKSMGLTGLY